MIDLLYLRIALLGDVVEGFEQNRAMRPSLGRQGGSIPVSLQA